MFFLIQKKLRGEKGGKREKRKKEKRKKEKGKKKKRTLSSKWGRPDGWGLSCNTYILQSEIKETKKRKKERNKNT